MADLLLVALAAATVNNPVAWRLLGLGPVLDGGLELVDVPGVAFTTTLAATLSAVLCHLLEHWVLVPYELPYLRILSYLALTALAVQLATRLATSLVKRPSCGLPLVMINGLVFGVVLLDMGRMETVWSALASGFGAGAGFGLILLVFAGLRPRLERSSVPTSLRGPGIALITLGMTSLAFVGFSGLGT